MGRPLHLPCSRWLVSLRIRSPSLTWRKLTCSTGLWWTNLPRASPWIERPIRGSSQVTVTTQSPGLPDAGATRSFSPESVAPMGEVVVTINVANYGDVGELVETLPDGFTYVSTTHGDVVRERPGAQL